MTFVAARFAGEGIRLIANAAGIIFATGTTVTGRQWQWIVACQWWALQLPTIKFTILYGRKCTS